MAHRPLVEVVGQRKRSTNGAGQRYTVFVDEKAITGNHRYLSVGLQNVGLSLYAIAMPNIVMITQYSDLCAALLRESDTVHKVLGDSRERIGTRRC